MNTTHLWLYITICVLALVTSKIIIAFLLYSRWYRKRRVREDNMAGGKMVLFKASGKDSFTSETLLKKILNLANKDIIGTGGFATVYKVVIDEHTAFAIKRLSRGSIDQERGFERELNAMGDIKHRNVVALRGYYKSSPNIVPLDWSTRHKIALGAARGIAYLHHDCIPRIIHRNIKSSNILLDEDMDARIADFGLATLINPQQSHVSTLVAGTFGYLAPEYVDTGRATEKGDVYSYGVVLVELLAGKRPTDEAFVEKGNNMVASVKSLIEDGCEVYAFDAELTDLSTQKEIKDAFLIAYKCLNQNSVERPTMAQVVKMLEQIKSGSFT